MDRRKSREVKIGNVIIGGNNPVAIQSMTFTKTSDKEATLLSASFIPSTDSSVMV